MFNPQYDWLSCKLRTIPIIDIYKSISEDCHLGHTFGSYLCEYLDTQLWACLSSQNIGCQHHDTHDPHSGREPCSWAKYLVFLPNFAYVLSGNNQSREVTGYIWHFLISTETSVKSTFLEIHWVHDLTWDIIQINVNLSWQHSNSCKSLAIIVESQAKIFLCINKWFGTSPSFWATSTC